MRAYVIRRLLLMIPTFLFVTLIVFFSFRMIPGSAIDMMIAETMESELQEQGAENNDLAQQLPAGDGGQN